MACFIEIIKAEMGIRIGLLFHEALHVFNIGFSYLCGIKPCIYALGFCTFPRVKKKYEVMLLPKAAITLRYHGEIEKNMALIIFH